VPNPTQKNTRYPGGERASIVNDGFIEKEDMRYLYYAGVSMFVPLGFEIYFGTRHDREIA
jgi:hypothetical protein